VPTVTPTDSLAATAVEDDPFHELVHNDALLLRAEFDDLIDASWGPTNPSDRSTALGPAGRPRRRSNSAASGEVRTNGAEPGARQRRSTTRSPPS
jgi:hypothetical protein